jgi:hypothetical protein
MTTFLATAVTLAQDEPAISPIGAGIGVGFLLVWLAFVVLMFASMWIVFAKAGKPGWAAIIPIYNVIVLLQVAGKPIWWILLMLIPLVNIVVAFLVMIGLARNFGQGTGFGIGLTLLGFIFFPILAFGSARHQPQA